LQKSAKRRGATPCKLLENGVTDTKLDALGYIQPVQLVVHRLREPMLKFARVNHRRCRIQNAGRFFSQGSWCSSKQTVAIVNTAGDESVRQGLRRVFIKTAADSMQLTQLKKHLAPMAMRW
jgi:hypothetical protein